MGTSDPSARPILAPVQQAERIQIIDILRGFALFGILVVNMALFSRPFQSIPCAAWVATVAQYHLVERGLPKPPCRCTIEPSSHHAQRITVFTCPCRDHQAP